MFASQLATSGREKTVFFISFGMAGAPDQGPGLKREAFCL